MDEESKALALYEKIANWKEFQPDDLQAKFEVLITSNRIEVVNKKLGALVIDVVAPDQFGIRAPHKEAVIAGEREMLEAVKQWYGFPSYPPS